MFDISQADKGYIKINLHKLISGSVYKVLILRFANAATSSISLPATLVL